METKTLRRNIPEERENANDRFRVKYNQGDSFDQLEVIITRKKTGEVQRFYFSSKDLPDTGSIYFSTSINENKMYIHWDKSISEKEKLR